MEVADIEQLLKKAGINEKGIFYGLEEISTRNMEDIFNDKETCSTICTISRPSPQQTSWRRYKDKFKPETPLSNRLPH